MRDCCGRASAAVIHKRRYVSLEPGVQRRPDDTVARGYRELRSPAAMRKLLLEKIKIQHGLCYWCHDEFEDISEVVADHKAPRGMGAARRDDSRENVVASCGPCNSAKGSRRDFKPDEARETIYEEAEE